MLLRLLLAALVSYLLLLLQGHGLFKQEPSGRTTRMGRLVSHIAPLSNPALNFSNNKDADDLSFSAGDIIEIVEETNSDWWMGKVHGKQALFPSSYVEKITTPAPRSVPPLYNAPAASFPTAQAQDSGKPAYRPFMAAHHGSDAPPATNSIGLQSDTAGQEKKKNKFGKYGNTVRLPSAFIASFSLQPSSSILDGTLSCWGCWIRCR